MELDSKNMKKIIIILCVVVLFWTALNHLGTIWDAIGWFVGVLMPVILGFAVAFIMEPFTEIFEDRFLKGWKKLKIKPMKPKPARILSVVTAYLVVIAVLALLIVLVVPQIRDAYYILVDSAPTQLKNAIIWVDQTAESLGIRLELLDSEDIDWGRVSESLRGILPNEETAGNIVSNILGAAGSLVGTIADIGLGAIIGFYILVQREQVSAFYRRLVRAYTTEKAAANISEIFRLCTGAFKDFMTGQLTEAVVMGFMSSVGLAIFRFPYPVAVGAVLGFTALIPVFGAWAGGIIGFLLALTESPIKALLFIVFIICLQMLDNTFIYPRIVGNSMKLEGLVVLCAVTIGGSVAGVAGMLLGVPAFSVLYTLINRSVEKRLSAKHLEKTS